MNEARKRAGVRRRSSRGRRVSAVSVWALRESSRSQRLFFFSSSPPPRLPVGFPFAASQQQQPVWCFGLSLSLSFPQPTYREGKRGRSRYVSPPPPMVFRARFCIGASHDRGGPFFPLLPLHQHGPRLIGQGRGEGNLKWDSPAMLPLTPSSTSQHEKKRGGQERRPAEKKRMPWKDRRKRETLAPRSLPPEG